MQIFFFMNVENLLHEDKVNCGITLIVVCRCGHMDIAKLLVTELQADVRVKDRVGFTPLHAAAKNGHANIVSFLLTQPGIDPVSD